MESYTYKDILFGLRKEFLKVQKVLNTLKKYIEIDNKIIKDFDLTLFNDENSNETKFGINILSIINSQYSNQTCRYLNNRELLKKIENGYTLRNIRGISIKDKEVFMDKSITLLNLRFSNKMKSPKIKVTTNFSKRCFNNYFSISPSAMKIYISEILSSSSYDYDPIKDIFTTYNSKKLTKEDIIQILDIRVPKQALSKYQQRIIDSSNVTLKEIVIPTLSDNIKNVDFSIEEDNKKIILVKKY